MPPHPKLFIHQCLKACANNKYLLMSKDTEETNMPYGIQGNAKYLRHLSTKLSNIYSI